MFPFDRISLQVFGRASARLTSLGHPGLFLFDDDDGEDEDDEDPA